MRYEYSVGDLIYPTYNMISFGYSFVGIVIGIYGGRYRLAFPDGTTQVFHPAHLKPDK